MLSLTMFPALDGDSLLISWGSQTKPRHLLVDLGRATTYKSLRSRLKSLSNIELFVVSHIDADHIAGAVPLARESKPPFAPARVWFNGRPQLIAARDRAPIHEPLSARQGEKLSRGIVKFDWKWNADFRSEIVSTNSEEANFAIPLPGGLSIALLSPRDQDLIDLVPTWEKELATARLRLSDPDLEDEPTPEQFEVLGGAPPDVQKLAALPYLPDTAPANGSSIAFIAEFSGKRILLAADAHSEVLEERLEPLALAEGGRYRIDLFKISHHGSRANMSPKLAKLIDCTRFAISTDGSRRHAHPHPESIARLLTSDPDRQKTFYFNYRQPQTELWYNTRLMKRWNYECCFPLEGKDMINGLLKIDV
jgi:beta-lactamase superfamily II metal-dependent hydrolase